jgi:two-component system, LuxR family, response regulator TtrR
MLRASGLRVVSFSSGEELLEAYDFVRPSCLIVDVVLSGMSGADLVEKLRAARKASPVIFVTGRIDAVEWLGQRGLGDIHCLQKPFEPALLVGAVVRAIAGEAERHR